MIITNLVEETCTFPQNNIVGANTDDLAYLKRYCTSIIPGHVHAAPSQSSKPLIISPDFHQVR